MAFPAYPEAGKASNSEADIAAQSSDRNRNKKKKKKAGGGKNNKLLTGAPIAATVAVEASGVVAHEVTSSRGSPLAVTRVVRGARYTTPGATTRTCARRSGSPWSYSVSSRTSSRAPMARLSVSRKASSKLPLRVTRRRKWSSRMPRGCSRMPLQL
jgi:hypothetical protein